MTCVGIPTWPVAALPHRSSLLCSRNGPFHATSVAISVSPNHSHKLCQLTSGRAGRLKAGHSKLHTAITAHTTERSNRQKALSSPQHNTEE